MFYSEFSKVTLCRESFACWSPWLKFEGCRLGIGTWCGRFFFSDGDRRSLWNTLDFLPCNDHPLVFFWRVAQLPTTSASHCRCFLILVSLPLSMRLTPLVHGFSPLVLSDPLDTFRQIATTWPRQQRISLVGSGTDPRNTFPECVEKGSRLGSPGGEVFVSKNKQIRASVQRKCWIVCEGKMGTKQHR